MAKCLSGCACKRHARLIRTKHPVDCECLKCYDARHQRVRRHRGTARKEVCVLCAGPAREWAHIHETDPNYPVNYQAMCVKCHRSYDGWSLMISEAQKKRWAATPVEERNASPEYRKKMSEAMKARWARTRKEQGVER